MEKSLNYFIREQKMSVGQFAGNTHPLPLPKGYSLYTSLFNKKSFNKRVRYKQNLRDLITKNQ